MRVYENIRIYIKANHLKTANIAKKAGISAKTLDEMLSGKKPLYSDDLRAICYAMNVTPEKFM